MGYLQASSCEVLPLLLCDRQYNNTQSTLCNNKNTRMRLLQLRDYNVNLVTLHMPPPETTCPQVQQRNQSGGLRG